ncbi:MAG TPA: ATP-binding protein [Solirubrobacteraceae bacterium]|nr:ATP-binding protein [Solirubrobacteraceae bacterium]
MLPLPSPPETVGRARLAERFVPLGLVLEADPSQLKRARDFVAAAAAEFGFARKAAYELVFAVNEAVTNAIKHGSPDEDGNVWIGIEADGDSLVCTVRDRGPFVPRSSDESGESGRGFHFMTALTDDFELVVEPEATVVRLRKLLPTSALVARA